LSDHATLGATYEFRQLFHDNFDTNRLLPPGTPPPDANGDGIPDQSRSDLRATANQGTINFGWQEDYRDTLRLSGGAAEIRNESSPRTLRNPDAFPIGSGTLQMGLGEHVDALVAGSHDYVGTAAAALDDIHYDQGVVQGVVRPIDWTAITAQYAFTEYERANVGRNTVTARALRQVWEMPAIEIGYQFTYDDTTDEAKAQQFSPLFYLPDQFTGNEGVVTLQVPAYRTSFGTIGGTAVGTAGVGRQKRLKNDRLEFDTQPQGSFLAGLQLTVGDRLGVFARGGRNQAANFESYQMTAGVSYRF
jgi:hypothetical protein